MTLFAGRNFFTKGMMLVPGAQKIPVDWIKYKFGVWP